MIPSVEVKAHPPLVAQPDRFSGENGVGIPGAGRTQTVVWDGIGWSVAWNRERRILWVVADSDLVGRFIAGLTRLAECAATWSGGLDEVAAAAKKNPGVVLAPIDPAARQLKAKEEEIERRRVAELERAAKAVMWSPKDDKDLPPGVRDKDTALRGLTAMVRAAYRLGATPDEVRLAVYAGMGLDSEGLDAESAAG